MLSAFNSSGGTSDSLFVDSSCRFVGYADLFGHVNQIEFVWSYFATGVLLTGTTSQISVNSSRGKLTCLGFPSDFFSLFPVTSMNLVSDDFDSSGVLLKSARLTNVVNLSERTSLISSDNFLFVCRNLHQISA